MIKILDNYKKQVFPFIKKYLQDNLDSDFHYQITSDYSFRQGKYLRPSLLLMTAGSLGLDIQKAIPTAAAMQISEDWILNHDDIEDDSQERRGLPSLHHQIGTPLAINAGDALHALNWQLIHSLGNE
jgi:geranylgeranyl diphosphate synthase type II